MGINVVLQTETGEILQTCLDPQMLLPKLLRSRRADLSSTVCLRFIDPIGDTVFNREQAPALLGELAGLRPTLDPRTRELVDYIIQLAEKVEMGPHLYLKFEGD